jgi:methyl-accepting chemotaxis protein
VEIIIVAIIGYFSLILSHRIAGPAYALSRDLKRLADGDLTVQIQLRKGDFHMETAEALNLTAGILRNKISAIKSALADLEARQDIDEATRQVLEQVLLDVAYFKTEPCLDSRQSQAETQVSNPRDSVVIVEMHKSHAGR